MKEIEYSNFEFKKIKAQFLFFSGIYSLVLFFLFLLFFPNGTSKIIPGSVDGIEVNRPYILSP